MTHRWMALGLTLVTLLVLGSSTTAAAEPRRFALLVGAATGEAGQERLHFAETDAERIAAVLREVGGFAPEDVVVLNTVSASEVRRALIAINARIRAVSGDSLLFVYYSGHADAEALQMARTRLPVTELRDLVTGSPATARVLVIDACRSGAVTRIKGGTRVPSFQIDVEERLRSKGVAILTSSADGEDSQESDELRASFFTHYLASGLRGAADSDTDSRVTLVEAFTYAAERTLAATSRTLAGPQHPTYSFDLTGRAELVLTRPIARGERIGTLAFSERGTYFVQQRGAANGLLAETEVSDSGRSLALPAGAYLITRRAADHLLQGEFSIVAGEQTHVRGIDMERVSYARVVRKGGTALRRSLSAFAAVGLRSGLGDTDPGVGGEGGVRVDLPALSLELRLHSTWFGPIAPTESESGRALGATLVGLRSFDLNRVTLAVGAAIGGVRFVRELGDVEPATNGAQDARLGMVVGGIAQAQRELGGPVYLRLEIGALGHIFEALPGDPQPQAGYAAAVVWSTSLGVGAYF